MQKQTICNATSVLVTIAAFSFHGCNPASGLSSEKQNQTFTFDNTTIEEMKP
jgi:hypothetical protein